MKILLRTVFILSIIGICYADLTPKEAAFITHYEFSHQPLLDLTYSKILLMEAPKVCHKNETHNGNGNTTNETIYNTTLYAVNYRTHEAT